MKEVAGVGLQAAYECYTDMGLKASLSRSTIAQNIMSMEHGQLNQVLKMSDKGQCENTRRVFARWAHKEYYVQVAKHLKVFEDPALLRRGGMEWMACGG